MTRKIFFIIFSLMFVYHCGTSKSYIKRPTPDSTFATAKKGGIIYSTSDFRMTGNKQGIVYKNWRFERAGSKTITFLYEEHYDFMKIQPDFKEELTYTLSNYYQVKIQGLVLTVYGLSDKEIVYYIKSER